MSEVNVYLYDALGSDKEISLEDIDATIPGEKQLLWVNLLKRDAKQLSAIAAQLALNDVPVQKIIDDSGPPDIDSFGDFFRFSMDSVVTEKNLPPEKLKVDFLVGKNFVVTIHEGEVGYFSEFREREKGETPFGELDAESFVATLIDLNIVSYFHAIDELERQIDKVDQRILKSELGTEEFLDQMIRLRKSASRLRRWLTPHRKIIYALSRADFRQIAESDSFEQFKALNQHFESAMDAVQNSRETVRGVFDLYATKSAQMTNFFVKRLTFLTLITGSLSVIAGVLGMNYKTDFFDVPGGFWLTVGGMVLVAIGLTIVARVKRWI